MSYAPSSTSYTVVFQALFSPSKRVLSQKENCLDHMLKQANKGYEKKNTNTCFVLDLTTSRYENA
jgi:hypothetical protein